MVEVRVETVVNSSPSAKEVTIVVTESLSETVTDSVAE